MSRARQIRRVAGALLYDVLPFERRMHGRDDGWLLIRNRNERITPGPGGLGVRCEWRFTSDLHIVNVFPWAGARLMRRAFARWPITMHDRGGTESHPDVSFVIGHRGLERLPQLLATCLSIAGQTGAAIECVVVEQSGRPEIREALPPWIRYVYTPLPRSDLAYSRAWAFNVGARQARGRTLIFHDNDLLAPERYAFEALQRSRDGFAFIDLKRFLFYLTEAETARLTSEATVRTDVATTIVQNAQGGSIVADREAFFSIGGFDEAFVGWGGEDNDFWDRARTTERVWEFGYLPFIHLHHPPQPGKEKGATAAVERYRQIESIPPRRRIEELRRRDQGQIERPDPDAPRSDSR